jgi:hypothetical protein
MLRLNIIKHGLTSSRDDDAVAEFQEFEGKGKPDASGPTCDQDGTICKFHEGPLLLLQPQWWALIDKYIDRAFFLDRMR